MCAEKLLKSEMGNAIRVNIDKYLNALNVFDKEEDVQDFRDELRKYGIHGTVDVYEGPQSEDEQNGEVFIPYSANGHSGFLKLEAYTGNMTDSADGSEVQVDSDLLTDFIGGLFGGKEVSTTPTHNQLLAMSGCWVAGGGACVLDQASSKRSPSYYSTLVTKLLEMADKLIRLSVEQDKGPFGIDPDDLRKIKASHEEEIAKLKGRQKFVKAREMVVEMMKDSSGRSTIKERIDDIPECEIECRSGSCGEHATSYGIDCYVSCNDLKIESAHISHDFDTCQREQREHISPDRSSDLKN